MNYFPVFFDLAGQRVLVVGGGEVALRKVSLLERTGASITVVAPRIAPETHGARRGRPAEGRHQGIQPGRSRRRAAGDRRDFRAAP